MKTFQGRTHSEVLRNIKRELGQEAIIVASSVKTHRNRQVVTIDVALEGDKELNLPKTPLSRSGHRLPLRTDQQKTLSSTLVHNAQPHSSGLVPQIVALIGVVPFDSLLLLEGLIEQLVSQSASIMVVSVLQDLQPPQWSNLGALDRLCDKKGLRHVFADDLEQLDYFLNEEGSYDHILINAPTSGFGNLESLNVTGALLAPFSEIEIVAVIPAYIDKTELARVLDRFVKIGASSVALSDTKNVSISEQAFETVKEMGIHLSPLLSLMDKDSSLSEERITLHHYY